MPAAACPFPRLPTRAAGQVAAAAAVSTGFAVVAPLPIVGASLVPVSRGSFFGLSSRPWRATAPAPVHALLAAPGTPHSPLAGLALVTAARRASLPAFGSGCDAY